MLDVQLLKQVIPQRLVLLWTSNGLHRFSEIPKETIWEILFTYKGLHIRRSLIMHQSYRRWRLSFYQLALSTHRLKLHVLNLRCWLQFKEWLSYPKQLIELGQLVEWPINILSQDPRQLNTSIMYVTKTDSPRPFRYPVCVRGCEGKEQCPQAKTWDSCRFSNPKEQEGLVRLFLHTSQRFGREWDCRGLSNNS